MRTWSRAFLSALAPLAFAACGAATTGADKGPDVDVHAIPTIVGLKLNATGTGTNVATINSDGSGYHSFTATSLPLGTAEATHGGRFVVFTDGADADDQRLWVIDDSGNRRLLVGSSASIASAYAPSFSPDLQWVYFRATSADNGGQSSIWRVKLDGSALSQVGKLRPNGVGAAQLAPDARTLMETTSDSVVFTSLSTGATRGERVSCAGARYSPDGLHVSCIRGGQLLIYDAQFANAPRTIGEGNYNPIAGTDWTPDGLRVLATSISRGPELVSYSDGSVISASIGPSFISAAFVK